MPLSVRAVAQPRIIVPNGAPVLNCGFYGSEVGTWHTLVYDQALTLPGNGRPVQLAGEYDPRRADLSGLLFHNEDGNEAGGLVYAGKKDENGVINAGATLTFDQYAEDQIMSIQYAHRGNVKRTGMTISARPDEMGENLAAFYRACAAGCGTVFESAVTNSSGVSPLEPMVTQGDRRRLGPRFPGRFADEESLCEIDAQFLEQGQ